MSATFSTQAHLFAYSGTKNRADGSGMATRFARDYTPMVNNLGGYVDNRVHGIFGMKATGFSSSASPSEGAGMVEVVPHTSSREVYVCQAPITLQLGMARLVWTAGVEADDVGGLGTTITAIKVYLVGQPYRGAGAPTAFDTSALSGGTPGYLVRSVTLTTLAATSQRLYELADDSSTGFAPYIPGSALNINEEDLLCHVVVTMTGVAANQGYMRLRDFTMWHLPE